MDIAPQLKGASVFLVGNLRKRFVSGFAAILLLSHAGQGVALDLSSDDGDSEAMMMTKGMTATNFDPVRGKVQCVASQDLEKSETGLEKREMIQDKCFLRFPTIPFIPKLPYDVIATDYDNYALVSGAKDRGFVQIYSRTPNPGPEFIEKHRNYLAKFGYDPAKIKDTPQDYETMSDAQLAAMMSMPGMEQTLTNQFPDLGLKKCPI